MLLDVPSFMFASPRKVPLKDRETGLPDGRIAFIHRIVLEGEQVDCFADTDLTEGLNGDRDKLDTGAPVPVTAVLDVGGFRGKLSTRLGGLKPAQKPGN